MRRPQDWYRISPGITLAGIALFLGAMAGCGGDKSVTGSGESALADDSAASAGAGQVEVALVVQDSSGTGGHGPGHHLRDNGIAQLFVTFDTIRLLPASADSPGCGHGDSTLVPPDSLPPGHGPGGHGGHGGPGGSGGHGGHGHGGEGGHHGAGSPADSSFIELLTDPVTVDVMDLAATLGTLLAELQAPDGSYVHLALRLTDASAVTDSGVVVDVAVPARDSLLNVLTRFEVVSDDTTRINIVIDLDRSVTEVPRGSGNWILRPVLRGEVPPHGGRHGGEIDRRRG